MSQNAKDFGPNAFLADVARTLDAAESEHGKFHSIHEAYAVILEEVDEFWEQVRLKKRDRDMRNVRTELVQIAAMCWKTARSLGIEETPER